MKRSWVELEWLKEHLEDDQTVVVDCRFDLARPEAGKVSYNEGHIPGAVYFDLEKDLSAPVGEHGGRHPLPDVELLSEKLGRAGIDSAKTVVAYDDQAGAMASRFWWLLKYLGHEQVYVLNSGFSAWKAAGYPVTDQQPAARAVSFVPRVQSDRVLSMEQVKEQKDRPGVVLIDSREEKRYRGLEEPIDPVAGHIPGAVNYFWKDGVNSDGSWKSPEEQKSRFSSLSKEDEVIVYCGSGVTACPNVLALKEAGFKNVKLYAGSWSDWVSYKDNPVE